MWAKWEEPVQRCYYLSTLLVDGFPAAFIFLECIHIFRVLFSSKTPLTSNPKSNLGNKLWPLVSGTGIELTPVFQLKLEVVSVTPTVRDKYICYKFSKMILDIVCFPTYQGAEPGPVLRHPAGSSICVLCLPLSCGCRRLAALWPAVRAQTHLCVWYSYSVAGWHWQSTGSWTTRYILICSLLKNCL